jgi:hypothetical protein
MWCALPHTSILVPPTSYLALLAFCCLRGPHHRNRTCLTRRPQGIPWIMSEPRFVEGEIRVVGNRLSPRVHAAISVS